ncbi:MAG: hypothetical protein M3437_14055 [Chloroflexota bacterium]|nr:hypothetical protein [Chloroflexota bacterium]
MRTRQKYWLGWLQYLGLGLFMNLIIVPRNPERGLLFNVVFMAVLLIPLLGVISYRFSPTTPTKRNNNPRPSHPHLLDVLLFRNPEQSSKVENNAESAGDNQTPTRSESKRWYAAFGLVATATVLCSAPLFASIGLQVCEWLDTNLNRSGCIRQFTYDGAIKSINFSPDGQMVVFGGSRHTAEIWNMRNGSRVRTLSGHSNWVAQIAFSPDGSTVATASWDGTVRLWQVDNGSLLRVLGTEGAARQIASMAYSPDGKSLAVTSGYAEDRAISLWRVEEGTLIREVDTASNALAFTPDGTQLVTADQNGDLTFISVTSGAVVRTIDTPGAGVWGVWVSPDGSKFAVYTRAALYILQADTGAVVKKIEIAEPYGLPASLSPNWEYFTASGSTLEGQQLAVWDIQDGRLIKSWLASKHTPYDLTFAPDSKSIAVATSWEIARVWRVP